MKITKVKIEGSTLTTSGGSLLLPKLDDMRRWLSRSGELLVAPQLTGDHIRIERCLQHGLARLQQLDQVIGGWREFTGFTRT